MAAVAFGMHGNFLSSIAAAKRYLGANPDPTPSLAAILATVAPQLIGQVQEWCPARSPEQIYLERVGEYLREGQDKQVAPLKRALMKCMEAEASPFERSLLLSCRLCLEHIIVLSVAAALPPVWPDCPPEYINRLVDSGVCLFLPPQYVAVVNNGLLGKRDNALIAFPTSAGKTLLGELCLLASLRGRTGLVCYLAPYVALGRQVADSLKRHLPRSVRVHKLVGGHRPEEALDPDANLEVIVATPERLDLVVRTRPELLAKLRCVVADEAHMIQNDTRGVRLEGLITRLRLLQNRGRRFRIVLMSAVLPQYERLMEWAGIEVAGVFTDTWRPTARRLAVWRQGGDLTWYLGSDPVRLAGVGNEYIIGNTKIPWPKANFYLTDKHGGMAKQESDIFENVAYLTEVLHRRYGGGPILCYCSSKHSTRRLAAAIAGRFPELEPIPDSIAAIISLIQSRHRVLRPLAFMLTRGVAYHNASLPHDVRVQIEEAVKKQDLIAVTATTTLAEGVDLPFRFTVLSDWLTWEGSKQRPMPSLLFRNISGRCGRAGVMTEGDTIIFDNPLGDLTHTNPYNRHTTQIDLYVQPLNYPLESAISLASPGTDTFEACFAELGSQFLAAIPENPDQEDLVSAFGERLYATLDPGVKNRVLGNLQAIRDSLLDDSRGALATTASPLHLTEFGGAAIGTTFSPGSCRTIVECLQDEEPPDGMAEFAHHMLMKLGTLPEQQHSNMRKLLAGKRNDRFQIKADDLSMLLEMWLRGESLEAMFLSLPILQRSKKTPPIADWVAGLEKPSVWDDDFDKFCDVIHLLFHRYLPWVMLACEQLSDIAEGWAQNVNWVNTSLFLEYGVDSHWAVKVLKADITGERRPVATLGRALPDDWVSEADPIGLRAIRVSKTRRNAFEEIVRECIENCGGPATDEGKELVFLRGQILQAAGVTSN